MLSPRLVDVDCPVCGRRWHRIAEKGSTDEIEIRCRGRRETIVAKHTVLYRVSEGVLETLATRQ